EAVVVPAATFISVAEIPVSVINSPVEAYARSPVSLVEQEAIVLPTPVRGSPKISRLWRQHPGAGHPVIIIEIVVISPISRSPDVSFTWANWLLIHWKGGWANSDRDINLPK